MTPYGLPFKVVFLISTALAAACRFERPAVSPVALPPATVFFHGAGHQCTPVIDIETFQESLPSERAIRFSNAAQESASVRFWREESSALPDVERWHAANEAFLSFIPSYRSGIWFLKHDLTLPLDEYLINSPSAFCHGQLILLKSKFAEACAAGEWDRAIDYVDKLFSWGEACLRSHLVCEGIPIGGIVMQSAIASLAKVCWHSKDVSWAGRYREASGQLTERVARAVVSRLEAELGVLRQLEGLLGLRMGAVHSAYDGLFSEVRAFLNGRECLGTQWDWLGSDPTPALLSALQEAHSALSDLAYYHTQIPPYLRAVCASESLLDCTLTLVGLASLRSDLDISQIDLESYCGKDISVSMKPGYFTLICDYSSRFDGGTLGRQCVLELE